MSTTIPKAIICDIEGCLADVKHRLHFVDPSKNPEYYDATHSVEKITDYECEKPEPFDWRHRKTDQPFKKDWEAFYAGIPEDGVNEAVSSIITKFKDCYGSYQILFVTGRPEKYRKETEEWLWTHSTWHNDRDKLFMRPDFHPNLILTSYPPQLAPDYRPSHEVKREIYEREIAGKYDVLFCIEDNERDCEMYRKLGLNVLWVMS